jgi:hypothetical protein
MNAKTGVPFFIALISLLLVPGSCEILTGKPEIDLLESAREKVWESRAPQITVYFNIPPGAGITSPSGSGTAKQRLPFPILFNQIDNDYAFIRWAASKGRVETGLISPEELETRYGLLQAEEIFIENPQKTSTEITVLGEPGEITMTALMAERPQVLDWRPDGGTSSPVVINTPVTVRFSMKIRPSSFIWEYRNGEPVYRNGEGLFKNITVTGRSDFGAGEPRNFAPFFLDPRLEGDTLRLEMDLAYAREHQGDIDFCYIYVTLGQDIRGENSYALPAAQRFRYGVNNGFDEEGPRINYFAASRDGKTLFTGDPATFRVRPGDRVYLIFSGYDAITGTNLHEVYITEKAGAETSPEPRRFWYTEHSSGGVWEDLVGAVKAVQPNLPGLYIMEYEIRQGGGGLLELHLAAADAWGNISPAGAQNSVYTLYRERD